MPRRTDAVMASLSATIPALWPSVRASPRDVAQRPLPSMMMETWRGRQSMSMSASEMSSGGSAK